MLRFQNFESGFQQRLADFLRALPDDAGADKEPAGDDVLLQGCGEGNNNIGNIITDYTIFYYTFQVIFKIIYSIVALLR